MATIQLETKRIRPWRFRTHGVKLHNRRQHLSNALLLHMALGPIRQQSWRPILRWSTVITEHSTIQTTNNCARDHSNKDDAVWAATQTRLFCWVYSL